MPAPTPRQVPWVEKYRPKTVDDVAHQEEVVHTLQSAIKTGSLPHLLFYGPPGTGKTSTILALARELYGPELYKKRILELNASDDRGVDVIRHKVKNFAQTAVASAENASGYPCPPFKLIILDEADSMTNDAQGALRRTMETYSKTTRFCIICNYVSRIISPLSSRCTKFRFKPVESTSMISRLCTIRDQEEIKCDEDVMDTLVKLSQGDMRKAITYLQSASKLFAGDTVHSSSIEDIAGVVPESVLMNIMTSCQSNSFEQLQATIKKTMSEGYPVSQIFQQLLTFTIGSPDMNDLQKSFISTRLAEADKALIDGADEFLQLLDVSSTMMNVLNGGALPE